MRDRLWSRGHADWNRDFPVRYLLVKEDVDGEEQVWGRCAGVEGLFMDPVPPSREVLTLRGCTPDGSLRQALSPDAETGSLGELCVEGWDGEGPVRWWTLTDTVVIAQHAHRPRHPDRNLRAGTDSVDTDSVDVVVGAGVTEEEHWPYGSAVTDRFQIFQNTAGASLPVGRCLGVDGLFTPRAEPPPVPLELIGCEPAEHLLKVLRAPHIWDRDRALLCALDDSGRVMYHHVVELALTSVRPSVLGGALVDIVLTDGGEDRPTLVARQVWEAWRRGVPDSRNLWAPYSTEARAAWLELTATDMGGRGPDLIGGEYHLDGRFVTDKPGLHCALAEAVLGPGRYLGREWNALKDCLGGGFGVATPFTLVWHDAEVAREAMAEIPFDPERGGTYFDDIVRLLEYCGVTVVLR